MLVLGNHSRNHSYRFRWYDGIVQIHDSFHKVCCNLFRTFVYHRLKRKDTGMMQWYNYKIYYIFYLFFYIYSTHKLQLQSFLINLVISLFLKTWKHKLINIHFKETMIIQLYYFSMLLYRWFLIIDFKICILD